MDGVDPFGDSILYSVLCEGVRHQTYVTPVPRSITDGYNLTGQVSTVVSRGKSKGPYGRSRKITVTT